MLRSTIKNLIVIIMCATLGGLACNTIKQATRSAETDALLRAAKAGSPDSVRQLLLSPNVDVNGVDDAGNTALIEAARLGHNEVVQVLLLAKADINKKNNQGKTALMVAAEGGHEESVALLTQAAASK
jgi:uncharacterized protein